MTGQEAIDLQLILSDVRELIEAAKEAECQLDWNSKKIPLSFPHYKTAQRLSAILRKVGGE